MKVSKDIATSFASVPSPSGCTLSRRGYGVPLNDSHNDQVIELLRDLLTVAPKQNGMGHIAASFPIFQESASRLYIPRAFGLEAFGLPFENKVNLPRGEVAPRLKCFVGSMRPAQLQPVKAFMESALDPLRRGGIISLPCGGGKTVVALFIMSQIGRRTLIVAAKDFLLNQWQERIQQFLPDASVGFLRAQTCDVEGRDIVLVSLQSLAMKEYATDLLCGFDMCIFDECHHLGAEVFSRALPKVSTPITMGLSATLDRKDGLRRVFEYHLGPVVFDAVRERTSDFTIKVLRFPCPERLDKNSVYGQERLLYGGRTNVARMLTEVCAHTPRTELMMDVLIGVVALEPARRVLILTDRRAHIDEILECLVHKGVDRQAIGCYVGGMKSSCLKKSESCPYIIGTYAMAAEGFDVPSLDTLLLASPVSSIEQPIGRIGRTKPESRLHQPTVIDVVDDFSIFRNQAQKRKRFYAGRGYTITQI